MSLEKMHPAVKDQFCEHIYKDYIVSSSELLAKYEEYAKTIHALIPVSCYTNFRDSLFHFRKMVSCIEEKEIERQAFAVKEHLSRSLTDASSSLMFHLSSVAEELLKAGEITEDLKIDIRECLHSVKIANLRKRVNGMMISSDDIVSISHDEMYNLLETFYKLLDNNCSEEYAKYSNAITDNIYDSK